ncbi:hypothetical protein L7F22_048178 [Adiantum nelumboides]|nr:hypothetical protein [Adiantum nelumboides]
MPLLTNGVLLTFSSYSHQPYIGSTSWSKFYTFPSFSADDGGFSQCGACLLQPSSMLVADTTSILCSQLQENNPSQVRLHPVPPLPLLKLDLISVQTPFCLACLFQKASLSVDQISPNTSASLGGTLLYKAVSALSSPDPVPECMPLRMIGF